MGSADDGSSVEVLEGDEMGYGSSAGGVVLDLGRCCSCRLSFISTGGRRWQNRHSRDYDSDWPRRKLWGILRMYDVCTQFLEAVLDATMTFSRKIHQVGDVLSGIRSIQNANAGNLKITGAQKGVERVVWVSGGYQGVIKG